MEIDMEKEPKFKNLTPEISPTTLYQEGDLRIHLITALSGINSPFETLGYYHRKAAEGVGIEYCYDGEHYIVLCFIEPDSKGKIKVERIGSRVSQYKKKHLDNILKYEKMKKIAKKIVKEALESAI